MDCELFVLIDLGWIVGDYVAIRWYRHWAEQAFTVKLKTAFYSLLTLAASPHCDWAQYVPKVFTPIDPSITVKGSVWRFVQSFATTSQICCECLALCSPRRLRAPAGCLFTRCWSNVASCWAFSASGCSLSFSAFPIFPCLNPSDGVL